MKKPLVIIKFGGSVITDKQSLRSSTSSAGLKQSFSANKSKSRGVFRKSVVRRLAREIVEARKKKDFDLILVHGAGSFGHPIAKKYRLDEGYFGPKSAKGFVLCKKAMFDLSLLVWGELIGAGINSSIVQPSAIITTSNKKIKTFNTEFIEKLLSKNITPILFGDVVFDLVRGFSVVSGDVMVAYLAKKFGAKKIIFVSDVDGVYDKNPKVYKEAKLISEINDKNYKEVIDNMEVHDKNDISGEMKGKILAIKERVAGIAVQIVSGFTRGKVRGVLDGKNLGTIIYFVR